MDTCGGPIVEQATHFIDLLRYFGGEIAPESIKAVAVGPSLPLSDMPAAPEGEHSVQPSISLHMLFQHKCLNRSHIQYTYSAQAKYHASQGIVHIAYYCSKFSSIGSSMNAGETGVTRLALNCGCIYNELTDKFWSITYLLVWSQLDLSSCIGIKLIVTKFYVVGGEQLLQDHLNNQHLGTPG